MSRLPAADRPGLSVRKGREGIAQVVSPSGEPDLPERSVQSLSSFQKNRKEKKRKEKTDRKCVFKSRILLRFVETLKCHTVMALSLF